MVDNAPAFLYNRGMKQTKNLGQCARLTVKDYDMLPPGTTVIAGLSGGADSVALLHWLHTAAQKAISIHLTAAHLNHMLRGEASCRDEQFCRQLCEEWGIPLYVKRVDAAALAKEKGVGIEEAGRRARYAFFEELAQANTRIALAHTLSDRIETMLLNMKRGAALRGLCSIPPTRPLTGIRDQESGIRMIIRPLIECSRAQVEAYCAYHRLAYRTDQSNFDPGFRRNQIRLEVLPVLGLDDNAMRRMFRALEQDEAYLMQEARACGARSKKQEAGMPEALRNRLLREQLAAAGREPTQARLRALQASETRDQESGVPRNVAVTFQQVETGCGTAEKNLTKKALANCLDYDMIIGELAVSARKPGDRMHLCNGAGTKPLKKLFQERGVPPAERERRVILRDDAGIVWLEGCGCAHRCRVTESTKRLLSIHLHEYPSS